MKTAVSESDLDLLKCVEGETGRTYTVLRLLQRGVSSHDIAERFNISRYEVSRFAEEGVRIIEREQLLRPLDVDPDAQLKVAILRVQLVFSRHTTKVLLDDSIERVGDLMWKSDAELLKHRYFGKKTLHEVRALLARFSLP